MFPYVVQPGDTLLRIARKFGVNAASILAANPRLSPEQPLQPGLMLSIPNQTAAVYCIQPGDTVLRLAELFAVPVHALLAANTHLDPKQLQPGQLLAVPGGGRGRIVDAVAEYGEVELLRDMEELKREYPFLHSETIGRSVLGKPIVAIRLGEGPRKIHFNAAMHANEWITAPVLMSFIEDFARAISFGKKLCGSDMQELARAATVWFVPLVNPDGAELAQEGLRRDHPLHHELLQMNRQSLRFRKWKANARGVDLNDQFPAFWDEEARRRDTEGPGPRDYPGPYPLSEPEACALAEFTRRELFDLIVALHTQGREIYWNYRGYEPPESQRIAGRLGRVSGYKPVKLSGSDAGYKDWFIYEFRRPGFTVEVGEGINPLPLELFPDLYDEVKPLLIAAIEAAAVPGG